MHTSRDDYLNNTLRFVSAKEETQIYGAIFPESLTSPEIKETQAYQTYLGFATRATPPKKAQKFKKPASPKLTTVQVSIEAPTGKSKRVKRPAKKSTETPAREVALTEEDQFKEVRKKSTRDFHKTYPSGSGTVTKTALSVAKIKPSATSERTDDNNNEQVLSGEDSDQEKDSDDDKTQSNNGKKSDLEHETNENESGSESDHDESDENEEYDDEDETKITNKAEGDEDEEIDYTTSQLYDDVDIRLIKPVYTDEGFVQEEDIPHIYAKIVSPMDVHIQHEVLSQQTHTLLTVLVSIISDSLQVFSTVIPQYLPSYTPPPQQSKSTPLPTTEASNPPSTFLYFASVFEFNDKVRTLEKEVAELKKDDPLKTQVTTLVDEHRDAKIGATRDDFMNFLLASLTARITEQMVNESLKDAVLAKESSQPQSSNDDAATLTKFELKKILIDKMDKMYSLKRSQKDKDKDEDPFARSDRGLKKRKTRKDAKPTTKEPEFEVADSDIPHDQEENPDNDDEPKEKVVSKWPAFRLLKGTRSNYAELEYDFEECYKALSEKLDWENPKGGDYPFDLTKALPLVMSGNHQKVIVDYFFNNDLKYQQGGVSIMTYTTSITKTKAGQYDLPGIEDMVEVMRKHGYGYLKEIVVRRDDNDLYRIKEGDFPRLHINKIEDMLLLVVQNRLTNLSGDDVSDFATTLGMFTRSLVI
nr:hypothetical protein [Tanacetum cinerariifolium]